MRFEPANFRSYITPPVVVVFVMGIFWRRGTAAAATVTLAIGISLGVIGWVLHGKGIVQEIKHRPDIHLLEVTLYNRDELLATVLD